MDTVCSRSELRAKIKAIESFVFPTNDERRGKRLKRLNELKQQADIIGHKWASEAWEDCLV